MRHVLPHPCRLHPWRSSWMTCKRSRRERSRVREKQRRRRGSTSMRSLLRYDVVMYTCTFSVLCTHVLLMIMCLDLIAMATTCRWQRSPPSMRMTVSRYQCSSQWRTDCKAGQPSNRLVSISKISFCSPSGPQLSVSWIVQNHLCLFWSEAHNLWKRALACKSQGW